MKGQKMKKNPIFVSTPRQTLWASFVQFVVSAVFFWYAQGGTAIGTVMQYEGLRAFCTTAVMSALMGAIGFMVAIMLFDGHNRKTPRRYRLAKASMRRKR